MRSFVRAFVCARVFVRAYVCSRNLRAMCAFLFVCLCPCVYVPVRAYPFLCFLVCLFVCSFVNLFTCLFVHLLVG